MPTISLTDFVDVVAKAGRPKATKVRHVRERPDYEPAFDFYKAFREHVINVHRKALDRKAVSDVLKSLVDPKKAKAYPSIVDGYKRWWGRKQPVWFNPPRSTYASSGVEIIINPELGLKLGDKKLVIKLYLKDEKLTSAKTEVITDLMHFVLSASSPDTCFAVLDVRNAKLYESDGVASGLIASVNAELAYISSIWNEA
ncbi:hypothetical protein [Pseudoxanthomonas sp. SE1]|uniref:hypothetical protein n=1 Tax=Pseudoxanthomonas sp. SE1 TaxID=1664560 RepID=UPI00240E1A56|nr:hypothetical protein [Pseudoxanthomonas sp. SE1]WFC43774.1 hypothetical protein OY559_09885 [Pseudoxanthomonas sp. SE1]